MRQPVRSVRSIPAVLFLRKRLRLRRALMCFIQSGRDISKMAKSKIKVQVIGAPRGGLAGELAGCAGLRRDTPLPYRHVS